MPTVTLIVVDPDTATIEGASVRVYKPDDVDPDRDVIVMTVTTGVDGSVSVTLPAGDYTCKAWKPNAFRISGIAGCGVATDPVTVYLACDPAPTCPAPACLFGRTTLRRIPRSTTPELLHD